MNRSFLGDSLLSPLDLVPFPIVRYNAIPSVRGGLVVQCEPLSRELTLVLRQITTVVMCVDAPPEPKLT